MNPIPLLIDFDGVLKLGDKPAPDIKEFLNFINKKNIPAFVISNSTLKTSADIKDFFEKNNFEFNIPSMTASDAALKYVSENYRRVKVYCTDKIKNLFKEYLVEENPEAVVIGDLADEWSYEILNEIFRDVYNGADLIAMQKNKFWKPDGKTLCLDAGSFITAIEYATGKEGILIGKPSPIYFRTILAYFHETKPGHAEIISASKKSRQKIPKQDLPDGSQVLNDFQASFFMLGDDLETDINSAQKIGGKGILIYTGKTKYPLPADIKMKPDYEANNLTEVINILEKISKTE